MTHPPSLGIEFIFYLLCDVGGYCIAIYDAVEPASMSSLLDPVGNLLCSDICASWLLNSNHKLTFFLDRLLLMLLALSMGVSYKHK